MTVSVQDRPPRGNGIDNSAAVSEVEKFVMSADAHERIGGADERRVWMPDGKAIVSYCAACGFALAAQFRSQSSQFTMLPLGTISDASGREFARRRQCYGRHATEALDLLVREHVALAE
jgi:hypothetical protein